MREPNWRTEVRLNSLPLFPGEAAPQKVVLRLAITSVCLREAPPEQLAILRATIRRLQAEGHPIRGVSCRCPACLASGEPFAVTVGGGDTF